MVAVAAYRTLSRVLPAYGVVRRCAELSGEHTHRTGPEGLLDGMTQPEFAVLGPLALHRPGAAASLTAPKLRNLLTLFLLADGPVPASQVREMLDEQHRWADQSGPLHVAVHRLRRWLRTNGGHRLVLEPGGYRLIVPPGSLDAAMFRRGYAEARAMPDQAPKARALADTLTLWRGPVVADAPGLREQYAARQLERLRREATVELACVSLATGQAGRALPLIERITETSPYDEQLHSLLALSLAACGLQGEALAAIARTRRALSVDLGIDPGRHLREAQDHILRHRTGLRPVS
jgi:DNA-binding SARP family transcriptional activator